ncbi:hypothetical protein EJ05DRAFT_540392 [Pseudovirgaria hyperparasitica]|uniref:K Homology domain-containing protein n=1 Tax=Pseudovirgaria hyperparasitica TaxID=470096 RepID=A0A6A6W1B9_9PEZI|nr:uncharacterized protein EJ05DRAFT_540392 [Pseudovirgaria hyperparasitica]KAF2755730.1 hypothetical protein EJ05DRAFT_540392 [Pseudovirgaria hyperparasitica]
MASSLSPAEQLQAQADAEKAHRVTVEDVPDEDDNIGKSSTDASSSSWAAPMSEKAAGKKKAAETSLNVKDDKAFPSLGSASKGPAVNSSTNMNWGKQNGINGAAANTAPRSSGAPTLQMPGLRPAGPGLVLPGRHQESIDLTPSQMLPRHQMKKPIKDTLNDINRTSKAKVTMREVGGKYKFESQGPTVDDVRNALRQVARELGTKQSLKIPVPASMRQHIIGKGGAVVNGIKQKSGANIQLPKQDAVNTEDEDAEVDILIEGDPVGAELARREIQNIINEREKNTSVNYRLKDIPAEFYPFLSGLSHPHGPAGPGENIIQVKIPDYYHYHATPPPQQSADGRFAFAAQPNHPIQISGRRPAALQLRGELEREVERLRQELAVKEVTIEKAKHRFIVGEHGVPHHDFLEETGCTVILPPHHEDLDVVYVIGPSNRLEGAEEKAWDLVDSMSMTAVDVAKQHRQANPTAEHARGLFQYLRQRQIIEELERQHEVSIVHPSTQPTAWNIYARSGAKSARLVNQDLVSLIASHPPSRIKSIPVDPFYLPHLRSRVAPRIREDHGVFLALPEEFQEQPELVLVYEASEPPSDYNVPRGQPGTEVAAKFAQALQQAQQEIESIIGGHKAVQSQEVDAPSKFHDKIRRYVAKEQQSLPATQVPIQVLLANQRAQRAAAQQNTFSGLSMRGPQDTLPAMYAKVLEFIKQEEKDELARGYVTSCDFPQQYVKMLVGQGGRNIIKLREDFDVEINAQQEGKVEFKGPQAKAEAAKAHVLSELKRWKDQATHEMTVAPEFHALLIGAGGQNVNRLADRYGVRINFPKSKDSKMDDAASVSEAGDRKRSQAPQAANKVIITGPLAGADAARKEFEDLLKFEVDHSHTATIPVPRSRVGMLLGQGGREVEEIRRETGARIDVPKPDPEADPNSKVEITVKGTKTAVEAAKKLLTSRVKVLENTVTRTINVDSAHHKALIGSGGANIRDIVIKAGGPEDRRGITRMVRFPNANTDGTEIRVEGRKEVVDKIVAAIQEIAASRDSQVEEVLEVDKDKHRLLIGRGGEKRRSLESQFEVSLDIPKVDVEGPARNRVRITGQPDAVSKAKEHILELVKGQEGETIQVPHHLHHVLADNNNFFRVLRNNHKVRVDHGGQKPPQRPAVSTPATANGGNLPLITDDVNGSGEMPYRWSISEPAVIETSDETIPWILIGPSAEEVAKAKQLIESKLANAPSGGSVTGHLALPDSRSYGSIVGPGGSKINSLRKQTGTQIQVPRNGSDAPIEITGSKEGVEKAKSLIVELVGQGQRRE